MLPQSTRISVICPVCGTTFQVTRSQISDGRGKTCSRECSYRSRKATPAVDRFWPKVSVGSDHDCWEWKAGSNGKGYGLFYLAKRHVLAHRFSYQLHFGPIPDGLLVCHHCDNPSCVNPSHLFLGDWRDNARDMVRKGRNSSKVHPDRILKGSEVASSVLTEEDVLNIRKLAKYTGLSLDAIAKKYGVTRQAVWLIVERRNWKHLP